MLSDLDTEEERMVRSLAAELVHEANNPSENDKEIIELQNTIRRIESSIEKLHDDQAQGGVDLRIAQKIEKKLMDGFK